MLEIIKALEKYNSWGGKGVPSPGWPRKKYLEQVSPYLGNSLIKVIVGQRRVGKSYLLRQIITELIKKGVNPKSIFYLNKELVDFDPIRSYSDLQRLIKEVRKHLHVKGKMLIFLDEVQEIKEWEKVVNSLSQDPHQSYELVITGSNSTMLSSELATRLSGRYIVMEVFPFSFQEFCGFLGLPLEKKSYLSYLKSGGLPELFHLTDEETKRNYIASLRDTILLKDIVARYQIKDASLLLRLFGFLTDNIGNLFSLNSVIKAINKDYHTNHETVSNYVEYLKTSYLFHETLRFDLKGKRILAGNKKYYLNDLSFRNYLSSSFDPGFGKHLENSIYLHYRLKGYRVYIGSLRTKEIDFVVEKGDERKYVQVAYSIANPKVMKREFTGLEDIRDSYEKLVISLDDISFGNKDGIRHYCAWDERI